MTTTREKTTVSPETLREAFSQFPQGVVLIGAEIDGVPHGLVASTFTAGVSLDPPLASVAIQDDSSTWPLLRTAPALGISLFGTHQSHLVRQLAAKNRDHRFAGIDTSPGMDGALTIADSPVNLWTRIHAEIRAGDHTVVFLEILDLLKTGGPEALVFHGSSFKNITTP